MKRAGVPGVAEEGAKQGAAQRPRLASPSPSSEKKGEVSRLEGGAAGSAQSKDAEIASGGEDAVREAVAAQRRVDSRRREYASAEAELDSCFAVLHGDANCVPQLIREIVGLGDKLEAVKSELARAIAMSAAYKRALLSATP